MAVSSYKKHMRRIYVVHPTFWSKAAMWFFATFTVSDIKKKIVNIECVYDLFEYMNRDQIRIPDFVKEYDLKVSKMNHVDVVIDGTGKWTPRHDKQGGWQSVGARLASSSLTKTCDSKHAEIINAEINKNTCPVLNATDLIPSEVHWNDCEEAMGIADEYPSIVRHLI